MVAPNGIGRQSYWDNCLRGQAGIGPVTAFDCHRYRCRFAAQITDWQPQHVLGSTGLRTLDRTTLLALVAAKLALDDAGLDHTLAGPEIGVVLGSTMGSLRSISDFDLAGLRDGPRYVNPAHFPNAVINSPASQVSIRFRLQALNATIASGFTASLDAIGYALDMLGLDRARSVLAGGAEELCWQTFAGFYHLGALSTSQDDSPPRFAPMHHDRTGTLLGEGAAVLMLESTDQAVRRRASVWAEILGYGTAFSPTGPFRQDQRAQAAVEAMRAALTAADIEPEAVDLISTSANSTWGGDAMEATAIQTVFGSNVSKIPIMAVKSLVGESFSAAGALQVAATIGAMRAGHVPPTVPFGYRGSPPAPLLPGITHAPRLATIRTSLVLGVSLTGVSSALVIRNAEPGGCHG